MDSRFFLGFYGAVTVGTTVAYQGNMRPVFPQFGLFFALFFGNAAVAQAATGDRAIPPSPSAAAPAPATSPTVPTSHATKPDAPPWRNAVYFNVGLFSAIGMIGATYVYSPSIPTELEFGMGFGRSGQQISFMPKLALGSRHHRLLLGVGPSLGLGAAGPKNPTVWINGDIGYEYRAESGFSVALSVGFTAGVAGCWTSDCGDTEGEYGNLNSTSAKDWSGPQARFEIGKWY